MVVNKADLTLIVNENMVEKTPIDTSLGLIIDRQIVIWKRYTRNIRKRIIFKDMPIEQTVIDSNYYCTGDYVKEDNKWKYYEIRVSNGFSRDY
jgi:hypothetical protein